VFRYRWGGEFFVTECDSMSLYSYNT
jgi:hypothetical protein